MRRLLVAAVVALLLHPCPVGARAQPHDGLRLDGVRVRLESGTTQVLTVNRTHGSRARLVWWSWEDGEWRAVLRSGDGRIGYGGLVAPGRRVQNTGTTPTGTYRLTDSFGMHRRRPSWDLPYRRVREGDYWVQDNRSRYYNRYRNRAQGGFRWWLPAHDPDASERLLDYRRQYEFALVMDFNHQQVRHRGSGIFLHVNGRGATAGCVSGPRSFLREVMYRIDQDRVPLIAIGR